MNRKLTNKIISTTALSVACLSIFSIAGIPANAAVIWQDGEIVIPSGESEHFHFTDLSITHGDFWVGLGRVFPTAPPINLRLRLIGSIHLGPGESFTKHVSGDWPFTDTESFQNAGIGDQTLKGEYTIDSLPPVPIGPIVVAPGDTEDVVIEVNTPTPPLPSPPARYELWKEITNMSANTNWWNYEEEIFLPNFVFRPGDPDFIFLVHGGFWNAHITDISIWFENPGVEPATLPFEIHIVATPEPTSTLSLLALGTLGAGATLKRKLKSSQSTEKETTKVG